MRGVSAGARGRGGPFAGPKNCVLLAIFKLGGTLASARRYWAPHSSQKPAAAAPIRWDGEPVKWVGGEAAGAAEGEGETGFAGGADGGADGVDEPGSEPTERFRPGDAAVAAAAAAWLGGMETSEGRSESDAGLTEAKACTTLDDAMMR